MQKFFPEVLTRHLREYRNSCVRFYRPWMCFPFFHTNVSRGFLLPCIDRNTGNPFSNTFHHPDWQQLQWMLNHFLAHVLRVILLWGILCSFFSTANQLRVRSLLPGA